MFGEQTAEPSGSFRQSRTLPSQDMSQQRSTARTRRSTLTRSSRPSSDASLTCASSRPSPSSTSSASSMCVTATRLPCARSDRMLEPYSVPTLVSLRRPAAAGCNLTASSTSFGPCLAGRQGRHLTNRFLFTGNARLAGLEEDLNMSVSWAFRDPRGCYVFSVSC